METASTPSSQGTPEWSSATALRSPERSATAATRSALWSMTPTTSIAGSRRSQGRWRWVPTQPRPTTATRRRLGTYAHEPMTRGGAFWNAGARAVEWVPRISLVLGLAYGVLWYLSPHRFGDYLRNPRSTDFALYYRDARAGIEYGWSHMYDLQAFERATREVLPVSHDSPTLVSLSIPLLTWLAAPFALLPLNTGYLLWLLLMALCLAATFWLLAPRRPLHAAAWLLFAPLALSFALGQSAALVALSVAAGARLLRAGREWPAGLALGLALVKPQLVLLLPFCLLAAGRWRPLAAWVGAGAVIAVLTLAVVGPPAVLEYAHRVLSVSGTPATLQVISDAAPVAALPSATLKALAITVVAVACAALAWL